MTMKPAQSVLFLKLWPLLGAAVLMLLLTSQLVSAQDSLYLFISGDRYNQPSAPGLKGKLRLAFSADGLKWKSIDQPTLNFATSLGDSSCYAPSLVRDSAGTWHMVYGMGDGQKALAYTTSKDLLSWNTPVALPFADTITGTLALRAPSVYHDVARKRYMLTFAISNNQRFATTASSSDGGHNFRLYQTTTTDWQNWRPVTLLTDPEFSSTDAVVLKRGKYHYLFYQNATAAELSIRSATSIFPTGPYGQPSEALHGPYSAGGPTMAQVNGMWHMYIERKGVQPQGLLKSKDLETWADFSSQVSFPAGTAQGTIVKIARSALPSFGGVE